MKYYIRRKPDGDLIAIRYKGEEEAQAIVDYLNSVDSKNEYYYEYSS
jgi:hypothetical protein